MTDLFERLKDQTARRRAGATAEEIPDHPLPAPAAGPSRPATGYCAYWIGRFEALREAGDAAPPRALGSWFDGAPPALRPTGTDARLFASAVQRELPYQTVIDWLTVRAALADERDAADPDIARYWLERLAPFPDRADDRSWAARCRRVAGEVTGTGNALPEAVVQAMIDHPRAASGYLRCAARGGDQGARPGSRDSRSDAVARAAMGAPVGLPDRPALPVAPLSCGAAGGIGAAVGGFAGWLLGGAASGFRAGFAQVRQLAGHRSETRAAPAEQALAELAAAGQHLASHPSLVAFWGAVDREAVRRFDGRREAVMREMGEQPRHPLRAMFERQIAADPDVALWHARALAAFEKVRSTWDAAARGSGWAPAPEQKDRLQASVGQVPPSGDHPALIERAERLLRDLAQVIRQAFGRRPAAAPGVSP